MMNKVCNYIDFVAERMALIINKLLCLIVGIICCAC